MPEALTEWLGQTLGPHSVSHVIRTTGRKAGHGQRVRRVFDSAGKCLILKQVANTNEWQAEVRAYTDWVPAIQAHAPTLQAFSEQHQVLLLSEISGGRHPGPQNAGVYQPAGALLRRLHEAQPSRRHASSDCDPTTARLQRLLDESREVLTAAAQSFVEEQGDRLSRMPLCDEVPCHGDYRRHNWLLDPSNTLHMIDFGKSRWRPAAWDFTKLFLRPWWRRPDLARAFFEGYGRPLRYEEAEFIQGRMAVDAVSHTAFGVRHDSTRHVRFGRSRLDDLMSGHHVVPSSLRGD